MSNNSRQMQLVGRIFWFGFLGVILFVGVPELFDDIDASGWWPHSRDTKTYIDGTWMTGEYRRCMMYPREQPILDCGVNDYPNANYSNLATAAHVLPGRYHGRIDRKDKNSFEWRCQRNESSITCWALN